MNKKLIWWIISILVFIFLFFIFLGIKEQPKESTTKQLNQQGPDEWEKVRENDIPEIAVKGWSKPIFLEVSRLGWFESQHISNDGKTIYMFYYPDSMDFITLREKGGPFTDDGDTAYSEFPFKMFKLLDKYYLSEDLYTSSGISTDSDGNFFYSSNREGRPDGKFPGEYDNQNIFRNDEFLAFNKKEESADNPFYCKARDELWYDCAADQLICILRDAAKNNFSGNPILAPNPINFRTEKSDYFSAGLTDFVNGQPWLTSDCNTLYFTSNRGRPGEGPWIYRSRRLDETGDKWSKPEAVIKGKVAVGEPSMPADELRLFFVQFIMNDNIDQETKHGEIRTVMYYIERTK